MRPLRITCVTLDMACGGAQRVMKALTTMLADSGHDVTLTLFRGEAPEFFTVDPRVRRTRPLDPHPSRAHPFRLAGRLRRVTDLRRLLLGAEPEVVICFEDIPNVAVLLALAGSRVPVIACEHNDPRHHLIPLRWAVMRRIAYPWAAAVVALNDSIAAWCRTLRPRWPVTTIPNPLEPAAAGSDDPRPDWFGPRNLVAVGRLVPQKGFDMLVEAFGRVAKSRPDWSLTILGEGPDRPALERQVRAAGLLGRVHLPGNVAEPMRILPHADAFVLSSRYEGFGMALVEAMAAGLPVVSFACPSGPPAIIRDGIDGRLVSPGEIPALAAALAGLMDDPVERRRLGAAAREAVQRYAPARVSAQWDELLARVVRPAG